MVKRQPAKDKNIKGLYTSDIVASVIFCKLSFKRSQRGGPQGTPSCSSWDSTLSSRLFYFRNFFKQVKERFQVVVVSFLYVFSLNEKFYSFLLVVQTLKTLLNSFTCSKTFSNLVFLIKLLHFQQKFLSPFIFVNSHCHGKFCCFSLRQNCAKIITQYIYS